MDELNNIMTSNMNDPVRNGIGEHERYDEIMLILLNFNKSSTIITDEIINKFLDE
jgi:hypothetical protein